jgi:zinc protease
MLLCAAFLLAGALPAHAQDAAVPAIAFENYRLANGLEVILHVDRKLPVVHLNQWYHVGSKNERVGRSGFAHLFEHMMFQGSRHAPGEYFSYVEKAGANLFEGGVNGTTDWDRTNYFATVPSGNLENLLWLESDRLATLIDALTQEKLDNQRDVVKNERRQGQENQPYGRWIKLVFENLFPYRHPYANDVIGTHEDLTAATLDDVREFFRTYYTPNNLSLAVVGDFDPAEAKRLIEKYFGTIPAGPALDQPARAGAQLNGEKIVEVNDRVPQERTYFAWNTPAYFAPDDAELDLLSLILADGLDSRLQRALVYDRQLCSDVVATGAGTELTGVFLLWATARPGASLAEIERIVTDEIAKLAEEGPTSAELDRAKTKWEYQFVTGLERIGGFGGKADKLNQYNTFLGSPDKFAQDVERHRNVTAASAGAAAARWLATPDRLLVRFHPETAGRASDIALDRAQIPALGADRPFQAPAVESTRLDNGLEVFVVERHDLPKVAVTLVTRAGAANDPPGKEGLADFTAAALKRGTEKRSALEIEQHLGDLGTSLQGVGGRELASVSFEALTRSVPDALAIFADIVRNASFPAEEIEREKKIRLDALAQDAQDADAIAARVAFMLGFGRDHPYGRALRGLPASVESLTRSDLVAFHARYWKPGSSALIFAGDIKLEQATRLANEAFGSWPSGSAPAAVIDEARPVGPGKVYLIDRQDAAQTVVAQILPAPARKSADYHALYLADAVWGGGFGTRLNLNLREDKGYSYGVFSSPDLYSRAGVWRARGGVQTDKTKESVTEFVKELEGLAGAKPITAQELDDAKANRVRGYAQQFESLGSVAARIADLWGAGLPMSELQDEPDKLRATALDAVNGAAARYAAPHSATLLLVGDRGKIESGVRELELGEIVILDVEGRPAR